jgi:hypothetical protein
MLRGFMINMRDWDGFQSLMADLRWARKKRLIGMPHTTCIWKNPRIKSRA